MRATMAAMTNLEAKFPLADLEVAAERARALGYKQRAVIDQRDTFFRAPNGKLKLREEGNRAMLIFYSRDDRGPLKLSSYEIVAISHAEETRAILAAAMGTLAMVTKHRILMKRDNVRFHLDSVEGLGTFGEIEAVIPKDDDPELSRADVDDLLAALGVKAADLIDVSYFELLLARGAS
jgi:adenylate cyclase, class 2